jgi:hypothetical protein
VAQHVPTADGRAWQSLRAGFFTEAERLFERQSAAPKDWSSSWGRGVCRAIRGDWVAAGNSFATAAELVGAPGLAAGASLLAVVTLAECGDASATDVLTAAQKRTPRCPHLAALTAIERADDESLGDAFLMLPELAMDLAKVPLSALATARATRLALSRATRLERAWQRLLQVAGRIGIQNPEEAVASLRFDRPDVTTLAEGVLQARSRRPAIAGLAAQLTIEIDSFLERSTTPESLDLATEARDLVAYANAALSQTDLPSIVRPLGIPPRRVGN